MRYIVRRISLFHLLFFGIINLTNTQEIKYTFNIGNALGTMQYFKKQMLNGETLIGYEANLANKFSLSFSAGISRIKFDYYDILFNQIYNQKLFITLPVEVKKYYEAPNRKNSLFFGFGVVGNYCFLDKKEIRNFTNSATQKEKSIGFNIALTGAVGFKSYITGKSSIAISLLAQTDFIASYSKDIDKIKFVKSLFSLTYATKMSKK